MSARMSSSGTWENGHGDQTVRDAGERVVTLRGKANVPHVDERIPETEIRDQRGSSMRDRPGTDAEGDSALTRGTTRRQDSSNSSNTYTSPLSASTTTLRRSETVTSATGRTPHGVSTSVSSYRRTNRDVGDEWTHEDARESSGGSGGSGRRKPLPSEFRHGSLVSERVLNANYR